jgi:acetolactate synthase-1/2/3 large subunit
MTNAIRTATSGKNGASFISIPQDVISSQVQSKAIDLYLVDDFSNAALSTAW